MASSSRTRKSSIAAAASAAVLASAPRPALALDFDIVAVSPGIALSLVFGRRIEVGVSMDLRVTVLFDGRIDQCSTNSRGGAGVYAQAGWYSTTGWRFGSGIHGGHEVSRQLVGL